MAKKKFTLQGQKSQKTTLSLLITDLSPINVKTNFNSAIHQSKAFVGILENMFYVSTLTLVKKFWHNICVDSTHLNRRLWKTWEKTNYKNPLTGETFFPGVFTKKIGLY